MCWHVDDVYSFLLILSRVCCILCSGSVSKMSETAGSTLAPSSPQPSSTQQPVTPTAEAALPAVQSQPAIVQSQPAIVHVLPNQPVAPPHPEIVVVPPPVVSTQPTMVHLAPNQPKTVTLAQFAHKMPVIDTSVAEALLNTG